MPESSPLNTQPTAADTTGADSSGAETTGLDDAAVMRLLAADDAESATQLTTWLKAHARGYAPIVIQAMQEESGLSPEAARVVLDAVVWRAPADGETTLRILAGCLDIIARRITRSLGSGAGGAISDRDDTLVGAAVVVLTSNRPARQSETAIDCLAKAGPGGALVLARAFDSVRGGLRLYIVRRLDPADVLELEDNVVASLARSVSRLADELESPKKEIATRFLAELGSVQRMETSEIDMTGPLEPGERLFHASWGIGTVIAANDESVTIDFGSAGTRTLLRAFATLRHAG